MIRLPIRLLQFVALVLLGLVAATGIGHAAPARHAHVRPAAAPPSVARAWDATVRITPSGSHVVGNPAAKVRVVEVISYTCPHCAHFNQVTQGPLLRGYVRSGKAAIEIRNLVRDPADLAVAMLTNCGDPARFIGNHDLFLATQDHWIETLGKSTDDQRKRWDAGSLPTRLKAMATDFGFYPMMAQRGYTRAQVDACLSNKAILDRLVAQTEAAEKAGVNATPSFMVNGALTAAHDWTALEPLIRAEL